MMRVLCNYVLLYMLFYVGTSFTVRQRHLRREHVQNGSFCEFSFVLIKPP